MAEEFTFAGKKFPKPLVYAGVAATGGIVIYAWWTKGTESDAEELEEPETDLYGDERVTPTTLDTYDVNVDTRAGFKTDSEWFNAGIDQLIYNFNVADTATASNALDKYLNRKPLKSNEVPMVNYVINSIGPPPTGQRPIIVESVTTPPSTDPPPTQQPPGNQPGRITFKPSNVKQTAITFNWNPVAGATHYAIRPQRGRASGGGSLAWRSVYSTSWTWYGLQPGRAYGIGVVAFKGQKYITPEAFKDERTLN